MEEVGGMTVLRIGVSILQGPVPPCVLAGSTSDGEWEYAYRTIWGEWGLVRVGRREGWGVLTRRRSRRGRPWTRRPARLLI